jgi:hypothetical protein
MKRTLVTVTVVALAFTGGVAVASDRSASTPVVATSASVVTPADAIPRGAVDDSLALLNTELRGWYGARRTEVMAEQPLILVVSGAGIVAVRGDDSTTYPVDLTEYNQVKAMLHGVLGFQGIMRTAAEASDAANWSDVDEFLGQLRQVRALIPDTALTASGKARVVSAYDTLIAVTRRALDSRTIAVKTVRTTLREVRPQMMPEVKWIGRRHARDVEAALLAAKADSTKAEWASVVAVVTGPMTPRRDNLETAVVAHVLGEDLLGSRIFYSENLFSTSQALSYLGTVLGDSEFSVDMFDSSTRMWRDVFAPVSREWVREDFYTALAR